jgi:hypothetical protein
MTNKITFSPRENGNTSSKWHVNDVLYVFVGLSYLGCALVDLRLQIGTAKKSSGHSKLDVHSSEDFYLNTQFQSDQITQRILKVQDTHSQCLIFLVMQPQVSTWTVIAIAIVHSFFAFEIEGNLNWKMH